MGKRTVMAAAIAYALAGPALAQDLSADLVETARENGNFSTLVTALESVDLIETLRGTGPYTVFAPTDAAFASLPEGTVDALLLEVNRDALATLLGLHVVSGDISAGDLEGETILVETVTGVELPIDGRDGVTVGDATVVEPDLKATNGTIHGIDRVLLPEL